MPTLKVAYSKALKRAQVLNAGTATPNGYVNVGEFNHPDQTYPDSVVVYHGVRDLLYKRSAADPNNTAKFPNNICNMHEIAIDFLGTPRLDVTLDLPKYINTNSGKTVRLRGEVKGGKAPIGYQWFLNGVAVSGATSNEIVLDRIDSNRQGKYKLRATDAAGTVVETKECNVTVYTPVALTGITADPSTLALSVAADAANGKKVTFSATPADANVGALFIKTQPLAARATATISNNVLTVKPVAAGAATTVVVSNGSLDITINVTVAA